MEIRTTAIPVAMVAIPVAIPVAMAAISVAIAGATAPRTVAITADIRKATIAPRALTAITTVTNTAGPTTMADATIPARAPAPIQLLRHHRETRRPAECPGRTVTGIDRAISIQP